MENAIEGMKCPQCASVGPFKIWTTALATVAPQGVTDVHDFEWTADDECTCVACDHNGQVSDFHEQQVSTHPRGIVS